MTPQTEEETLFVAHPELQGEKLEVTLRRCSRKRTRLAIRVTRRGDIEVLLPPRTPQSEALNAVHARIDWILHHVAVARSRPRPTQLHYQSGETIWYLGNPIELQIVDTDMEAHLMQSVRFIPCSERITRSPDGAHLLLRLPSPSPDTIRKNLESWYVSEAIRVIAERLSLLCSQIPWIENSPVWKIKKMRRRWGSCSAYGELTFNTRLIRASLRCIDYVVLHEIAHLRELNHSPDYYAVLTSLMPDWKSARQELQHNAALFLE